MKPLPSRSADAIELAGITVLAWLAFVAIPLLEGGIGLSWDAINHHVYLGWTAESPRFDRDVLAAGYQSYQFPYLYWPLYRLAAGGASGVTAGVVLATLQTLAVPPIWLLARQAIPRVGGIEIVVRAMATAFAFCSALVLSLFDSTSNDLLAAIPMLWAIVFAVAAASDRDPRAPVVRRRLLLSAAFAGVAVACKLSNGPLAIVLPLVWWFAPGTPGQRIARVLSASAVALCAFAIVYGYWGWQLWRSFGSPFYPFWSP